MVVQAVRSALGQSWEPLEVVVVDDASSDDTVERLQQIAAQDTRLTVIARSANGGESVARNQGILAARHEYVALLDSDNTFMPTKLQTQMPALIDAVPGSVSFSGYVLDEDGKQSDVVLDAWSEATQPILDALLASCCVNTSTFLAPRSALVESGLFRTDLACCQDHDLWLRLAIKGHRFVYEPELLTLYRIHGGSVSSDEAKVARYEELVIGDFLARPDLPLEITTQRRRWRSHWALTGAERRITAGKGREALLSLARAAWYRPPAIRPGWLLLTVRAAVLALRPRRPDRLTGG
jgi:glycosyltransferase involved in cell wall biosynthesis